MAATEHSDQTADESKPVTIPAFRAAKAQGRKLVVLTAYDYCFARLLEGAGIDALLVGDSLGMVVQGRKTPLPVTTGQMAYHTEMVARAARRSLVIADMPFLSYQPSISRAVRNCGRMLKVGAQAVKIEGGVRQRRTIQALVEAEIPVMGHVGMTPQAIHRFGGFKVQTNEQQILEDALAVAEAGAFALVVECVPATVGAAVTRAVGIPTIGIGAGPACDGQVLVVHDLLGMVDDPRPKFVKRYAELGQAITVAARQFARDVHSGHFPGAEHSFARPGE
jgi:3-methyl-2-oxobutanoate hydroxymethyltransferase